MGTSATTLKQNIQIYTIKKSQQVTHNILSKILENNEKLTQNIEKISSTFTGKGSQLNIKI